MNKATQQFRERYEAEFEQLKATNYETIRLRFEKKKILMNKLCTKKDFHFIINSMLQREVFQEDILNEFWDTYFRQTASVGQIAKAYCQGIMNIVHLIIENNMKIHQLTKQRQKHQKDPNFKFTSLTNHEMESLVKDNSQFVEDLEELCKPFGLNLVPFIAKYKPFRLKQKATTNQADKPKIQNQPDNIFIDLQKVKKKPIQIKQLEEDTPSEEKYYRLCIYISIIVAIGDLSLSYSKLNFLDLLVDLLLLLNALLQNYLVQVDQFLDFFSYIGIEYEENKIAIFDTLARRNTFKYASLSYPETHSYERFAYSSMWILVPSIIFDLVWVLFIRPYFYYTNGPHDPYLLSGALSRYNHFVAGASIVLLIIKVIVFLLLFKTIDFQFKKLKSRYNIIFNCLRFTNQSFINQLIMEGNSQ